MVVEAVNSDGKTFWGEAKDLYQSTIEWLNSVEISEQAIRRRIDNLNISADWKRRLHAVASVTIKAKDVVVWIGRKILEQFEFLIRTLPNTTVALIFTAVVGSLCLMVPVIGHVLGPLVTGIFGLILGGRGVLKDIKDKVLRDNVEETCARFCPLRTAKDHA